MRLLPAIAGVCLALFLAARSFAQQNPSPRITESFDTDWRFFKGEPPAPTSTQPANGNYAPIDPTSPVFKDESWHKVNVPHDWSIEGPFDETAPTIAAGAYLPSGIAWYRKTFTLPPGTKGKRVFIEFDGVMANSDVYLNKALLGHRPNGYVPFRYDLTDYLDYTAGGKNLIAVRTDTSRQPASRWYTGAGIYRHTRLVIQNSVHIVPNSTTVTTTQVAGGTARVHLHTTVTNQSDKVQSVSLSALIDKVLVGDGAPKPILVYPTISTADEILSAKSIPPGGIAEWDRDFVVDNPQLWDISSPVRYNVDTLLLVDKEVIDYESTSFGIRTAEFRADTGFWLNGKNVKLLGVALHQDAGALGAAVPASAWESRLTELKKYGINAIRAAHAPMPPEFYTACDKLGLLVMDETFDAWSIGKMPADYHLYFKDWWQRDLEAIIKSHRNHPSIVIYSLGNEIWDILPQNPDPALDQFTGPMRSIDIARNIFTPMRDLAHQLDPTRPVTLAAMRPNVAGIYTNGFADLEDVIGQNYRDNELAAAHRQNPARKIIGTENYKTRETWLALRDNPALAGQFLWAGVDYLGEAGRWPNFTSPSGILDRTNAPKGEAFERQAWWLPPSQPMVRIVRMQSIPARPGRPNISMGFADWTPSDIKRLGETINVYSNCDDVELFINDQSLGTNPKNVDDSPRVWQVPFAPGTLKAIGKNKGLAVATDELKTAGPAAKILLTAERIRLSNDFDDVAYIRANITDAQGIVNPNSANLITFKITGPGLFIATDNGSLTDHTPFQSPERAALRGTCIAIIRASADTGRITLTAGSPGLAEGSIGIDAAPPPPASPNPER